MGKRESIAVTLIAYATIAMGQTQASFTVNPTQICATTNLNVTNLTAGSRLSYQWDFGLGASTRFATGDVAPANISYLFAGSYRVRLTVYDSATGGVSSDSVLVTVWPFPYFTSALATTTKMQCGDSVTLSVSTNVPARVIWTTPSKPGVLLDTGNHITVHSEGLYIPKIYMDTAGCRTILNYSAGTTVIPITEHLDTITAKHISFNRDTVIVGDTLLVSKDTVINTNSMVVRTNSILVLKKQVDSSVKLDSTFSVINQCGEYRFDSTYNINTTTALCSYLDTLELITVDTIVKMALLVNTDSSATITGGGYLYGSLILDGGAPVTTVGFELGVTTSYGIKTTATMFDTGTFNAFFGDMPCNYQYHYRAYASNITGTVYGKDKVFFTDSCRGNSQTKANYLPGTSSAINVFPNPFTASVSIERGGSFSVALYNQSGQKLLIRTGDDRVSLDLRDLNSGIYLVVIMCSDGSIVQKKIVKE